MNKALSNLLGLGLLAGLVGFAVYFFSFGQTFEGDIRITKENNQPGVVGTVYFQSRFTNRRFLTHSVYLDLLADTPTTYQGELITALEAVEKYPDQMIPARIGYREEKSGFGKVVTLDLDPPGSSPKEILLISSLVLIFGCTAGMAIIAKRE